MEIQSLIKRPLLRRNNRSINASWNACNLPNLIETMKQSYAWAKGELSSMILLNSPNKQIVLTLLREDTEIESSQSNDSITFHVIEGRLYVRTRKKSMTLDRGQLLTLHDKTGYRLKSSEETVFLLTIARSLIKPMTR
jgi:hypothetical protein